MALKGILTIFLAIVVGLFTLLYFKGRKPQNHYEALGVTRYADLFGCFKERRRSFALNTYQHGLSIFHTNLIQFIPFFLIIKQCQYITSKHLTPKITEITSTIILDKKLIPSPPPVSVLRHGSSLNAIAKLRKDRRRRLKIVQNAGVYSTARKNEAEAKDVAEKQPMLKS